MTVLSRAEIFRDAVRDPRGATRGCLPKFDHEETRFFADLGLASIDAVVLSEAMQKHYDRPLPFNELMAEIGRRTDRDISIGELVSFLSANL